MCGNRSTKPFLKHEIMSLKKSELFCQTTLKYKILESYIIPRPINLLQYDKNP